MARRRRGRALDGVLLLDKPKGISANQALQRVRRLFEAAKAGHTGTLDPMATGLLPVCFGEATKFSAFLLDADKRYHARIKLGISTDTGDAEGQVMAQAEVPVLTESFLQDILGRFRGEIEQVPPMYSALKHQGRPLYELAREGREIKRTPRQVTLHDITLCQWDATEGEFELDVTCSKGTYIRTLAMDIGEAFGCGAHLTVLRRLKTGPFDTEGMHDFESLEQHADRDTCLMPVEVLLDHLPALHIEEALAARLQMGQKVKSDTNTLEPDTVTRVYSGQTLLGLGTILTSGVIAPRRMLCNAVD